MKQSPTAGGSPKKAVKHVSLAMMTNGSVFGEDDAMHERLHLGTVTCKSNEAKILAIPVAEFFRRFKNNVDTWTAL